MARGIDSGLEQYQGGITWYGKAFMNGDIFTKLSYIIFGFSNVVRGQIIKGLMFFILETTFLIFMVMSGLNNLLKFITLGTHKPGIFIDPKTQIPYHVNGDNSMLIMLAGIVTILVVIFFIIFWGISIKSAVHTELRHLKGLRRISFIDDMRSLLDMNIHKMMLFIPILGLILFTVLPIMYMVATSFTNFDFKHQPPGFLFSWVGLQTYKQVFDAGNTIGHTFWSVLGWTMIWAVFSTFTCYFLGMLLALLINKREIKYKKFWRTIFVITMAVPSFISLLLIHEMLQPQGVLNNLLIEWGFIHNPLPFLVDATWARVTVIIVNIWIGVPSSMLIFTGILTNISPELYESARVDGANAWQTYRKITLPYVLYVTTPYLISAFVMNINNFSVIYLVTGGGPATLDYFKGAGKTDLLVTWLFRLTVKNWDYSFAAVIAVMVFVLCAAFSMIVFRRTTAATSEEEYQ